MFWQEWCCPVQADGCYHVSEKEKDGSLCKTQSEMELSYEYCPFCGHKFEEDKENKENKKENKQ